ncbi:DNA sulfur modification protein DndB [Aeromonas caviae]
MSKTTLPAIRSKVGDWVMYITSMSFADINSLVSSADEIHERKGLSEWIQRQIISSHADDIAKYILDTPQRFLGSLIIGVYNGNPNWAPLSIKFNYDPLEIDELQREKIDGKLGLLVLTGDEKLFAIDGQHRVAGIKKAVAQSQPSDDIYSDEVSVIFVSHDNTSSDGKMRTRRLFTTLNKKAKPISKSATIALDEDNGFAIVTRALINTHWLFEDDRKHISYSSTGAIPAGDEFTITSVVGLYEIVKDIYYKKDKKVFESTRPSDEEISTHLEFTTKYLNFLLSKCPEYNKVFNMKERSANYYRSVENHVLFRPIGQRAFARAVGLLVQRGKGLEESISALLSVDLVLTSYNWRNILWDPVSATMITKNLTLAETQFLTLSHNKARTPRNQQNLQQLLDSRGDKIAPPN